MVSRSDRNAGDSSSSCGATDFCAPIHLFVLMPVSGLRYEGCPRKS